VPSGIFPKFPEERSSLLFRAKGKRNTHPELPGREEGETEIWGKESFQAQCMRDYWLPLLSRLILPKGSTGVLEARVDLHSQAMDTMKEAQEI
jgi:hypothetical protein